MENFAVWMILFQGLFWVLMLALVVYLIVRRIRISEKERFEKRDN